MTMMAHLPILLVLAPLFGALVTMFLGRSPRAAWAWTQTVTGVVLLVTIALAGQVWEHGVLSYQIGRWPREYGIELRVDALNSLILAIIAVIGVVSTWFGRLSIAAEIPADRQHIFYTIWQLCLMGMLGMTITGDAFNVYVMLEISALTVYTLIAMGKDRDRRALTAALRYLVVGSIGATFILLGIGYLLMATGTLNMVDMAAQLADMRAQGTLLENRMVLVAFAFLLVGMSLKMALYPLHMWLPNAYTFAPSAVSAMLAATATKVGVYIAIRFLLTVFGYEFSFRDLSSTGVLLTLASAGILICSVIAIRQTDIKRLLAYSSVAQIGYMVLGFSLGNVPGIAGSAVHMVNHAMMKGGMFLALGCVVYRLGGAQLADLRGLGRRMPWTMAAFTAGGLGLIGFPLTAGFISKWYLVRGCLEAGYWYLAAVVLVGSLLAVIYVWKVVEAIYFGQRREDAPPVREAPASMVLASWSLIVISLVLGCWSAVTGAFAERAAASLLTLVGEAMP